MLEILISIFFILSGAFSIVLWSALAAASRADASLHRLETLSFRKLEDEKLSLGQLILTADD
jgi:hypothetical protein